MTARPLTNAADLQNLMSNGSEGQPQRVALSARGTFGWGCECPPFSIDTAEPYPESGLVSPVSMGAADIGVRRTALDFVLVGYFSGASIDTYERYRAAGKQAPSPDEEQRNTFRDAYPELCLEALCFSLPKPGNLMAEYAADDAAEMRKQGIPQCPRR